MSEKAPERIWADMPNRSGFMLAASEYYSDCNLYTLTSLVTTQITQARAEARREALEDAVELAENIGLLAVEDIQSLIAKDTK